MNKLYYNPTNGYLCDRYPNNIPHDDNTPFIEVDDNIYNQTFACPYGQTWAVIDGQVQLIEDTIITATDQYKLDMLGDKIFELQSFLTSTDYVVLKLSEAKLLEDSDLYNTLFNRYADILTQRENTRQHLNDVQQQFNQLNEKIEQENNQKSNN